MKRTSYLLILAVCGFVTSFGAHIVATNLPPYAQAIGAGAFVIGLLIAVYDFAELFAKPLAGFLADRRGMKLTLIAGLVIFILGSLLFLVVSPKLLLLVRFVQGLGAAALSTVSIRFSMTTRGNSERVQKRSETLARIDNPGPLAARCCSSPIPATTRIAT